MPGKTEAKTNPEDADDDSDDEDADADPCALSCCILIIGRGHRMRAASTGVHLHHPYVCTRSQPVGVAGPDPYTSYRTFRPCPAATPGQLSHGEPLRATLPSPLGVRGNEPFLQRASLSSELGLPIYEKC